MLPTRTRVPLYNSLILPHINYCIMAWGYQSNRISKLQKRAIRIVANNKYNAHTYPLFKLYTILKLSDVLTLQTTKVYQKFRQNELPVFMQNWPLITNNEIHQYNTRIASDLHTFRYHHTFARKSLRHYLVQTINNTPDNVFWKFGTHSLNGFSNYAKLNFINNYQDVISKIATYVLKYIQYKMQYYTITHANIHTSRHTHGSFHVRSTNGLRVTPPISMKFGTRADIA